MLIESMEKGSYWAPMGLREMKSEKAIPHMKKLIETAYPRLGIEIAVALNVIEETTEYVPYLINILQNVSSPYDRFAAAIALREFGTREAIDALFEAIKDPDYLVRNHASESLLAIHGLEPTISNHDEIFGLICTDSEDEESYKKAIIRFEKAIELLKQVFEAHDNME
jgi:HEAT repeat protein